MFTVLYRHMHSDWQSTEVFLYVIGKSNIMLTWRAKGRALMKMYKVVPITKRGNRIVRARYPVYLLQLMICLWIVYGLALVVSCVLTAGNQWGHTRNTKLYNV